MALGPVFEGYGSTLNEKQTLDSAFLQGLTPRENDILFALVPHGHQAKLEILFSRMTAGKVPLYTGTATKMRGQWASSFFSMPELLGAALMFVGRMDLPTLMLTVPLVCKTWQFACHKLSVKLRFSNTFPGNLSSYKLSRLLQRFPMAQALEISCNTPLVLSDSHLEHIGHTCRRVTSLKLLCPSSWGKATFTDKAVIDLVSNCPCITTLHLERVSVGAVCAEQIGRSCPQLVELAVDGVSTLDEGIENLNDAGIEKIATHCQNLTSLDIGFHSSVTSDGFIHVARLTKLTTLKLRQCEPHDQRGHKCCVTDKAIVGIAAALPNITALDISYASSITDAGLTKILSCCAKLRELNLSYNSKFGQVALAMIGDCCPDLLKLNTGCADESIIQIARGCPNLVELNLGCSQELTSHGLSVIGSHCPNLTILFANDTGVSGDGLAKLAAGCRHLKELNISTCGFVTDHCLAQMAVAGCPGLVSLEMEECDQVTDKGLAEITGKSFPKLEFLDITNCGLITDAGLVSIATCKAISFLCVDGTGVTEGWRQLFAPGIKYYDDFELETEGT
jgi:hypothetical protein